MIYKSFQLTVSVISKKANYKQADIKWSAHQNV